MRPVSASELLNVWEHGQGQRSVQRALALLAAACPGTPPDELAKLSIGRRDALLLTLREWTFGSRMACVVACPACGERLEPSFDAADIRLETAEEAGSGELSLTFHGREVRFRLPNSLDMLALAGSQDLAGARRALLDRCLSKPPRRPVPEELAAEVARKMTEADPQADVQLALSCPSCAHSWSAVFDITSFFWREIEAWACRVLREVHALAFAYGWQEDYILSLSPRRRQAYLQMVGG